MAGDSYVPGAHSLASPLASGGSPPATVDCQCPQSMATFGASSVFCVLTSQDSFLLPECSLLPPTSCLPQAPWVLKAPPRRSSTSSPSLGPVTLPPASTPHLCADNSQSLLGPRGPSVPVCISAHLPRRLLDIRRQCLVVQSLALEQTAQGQSLPLASTWVTLGVF